MIFAWGRAVELYLTAVFLNDAANHGQSKASPLARFLTCEEGFKNFLLVFERNTRSFVLDKYKCKTPLRSRC